MAVPRHTDVEAFDGTTANAMMLSLRRTALRKCAIDHDVGDPVQTFENTTENRVRSVIQPERDRPQVCPPAHRLLAFAHDMAAYRPALLHGSGVWISRNYRDSFNTSEFIFNMEY